MAASRRLRVLFAGTPAFAATALEALLFGPHSVVAVCTQPDRPAGRGRKLTPSPVKHIALAAGLPVYQPGSLRSAEALETLRAWQADVLIVAAYGLILPPPVLSLTPYGCVNIHASLLPRWRGAAPIQRALLAGDTTTGITIMQMDEGLDTGDILLTQSLPIEPTDTAASLHDRLAVAGGEAIGRSLDAILHGAITPRPQPREGATYAHKVDKHEAPLDFTCDAVVLDRRVRAFNPWPVAETSLGGERLRVWRSRVSDATRTTQRQHGQPPPGTVMAVTADALRVATGNGEIDLLELQRPGKRVLPAVEVARSLNPVGRVLGLRSD